MFPHTRAPSLTSAIVSAGTLAALAEELPNDYGSAPKMTSLSHMVEEEYSDSDFRNFLRLSRHGFEKFVAHVDSQSVHNCHGRPQTPLRTQCMVFLKYLGSQTTLKDIGVLFGMTESTVHATVRRILHATIPSLSETR